MAEASTRQRIRCAIYTRKSSEEGLEREFNSLHAQREACEAFIQSQRHEGWLALPTAYDDGGYSGGTLERPALQRLLDDIRSRHVDVVVVYKIDCLTRSLFDFAKIVEIFDACQVSFVSVTQSFNTTTSMGRLTLNVLLSFAQFEREVTGERIRDKVAASKKKGMWMGGNVPLGYDWKERHLVINPEEAESVRAIFNLYLELKSLQRLKVEVDRRGLRTKERISVNGRRSGGMPIWLGHLHTILKNPIYTGRIRHKGELYPGEHPALIELDVWERAQAQLVATSRGYRARATAKEPSLLGGRLYDAQGRRMTPSHAKTHGRRYRYYISSDLLAGHKDGQRFSAVELEGFVLSEIHGLLADEARMADLFRLDQQLPADVDKLFERAAALSSKIKSSSASEQRLVLLDLLRRVDMTSDGIRLSVDPVALAKALEVAPTSNRGLIVIERPASFRKIGKKMKLIINGAAAIGMADPALTKALARAYGWFEMLKTGQASSVSDIAIREKLPRTYVSSIVPFAFLAPDICRLILEGQQPADLTLDRLLGLRPFPVDWAAQRQILGCNIS